ncbi:hypothetical protein FEM48_Zijuj04G0080400 [Ziziphus jujuba var. spinosa]|uniref:non-specific serine/threonine protein kinase n=1 Tax=Ziziphus jujuba var. spinosa TaxID=714518 RepID=A0A978VIQ6_ZIZJJ|nr:hypothetical protein FEM48_Zijuj04G0080400 [Ziziphus jujuba var. spinosa]
MISGVAMEVKIVAQQLALLLIASVLYDAYASDMILNKLIHRRLEASRSEGSKAPCPTGWTIGPSKSKCFGYIGTSLSWNGSETHCNSYGGHLAALAMSEELNFAENLCGKTTNGCWVGGRRVKSTFGLGWKWSDNTSQWNESIFSLVSLQSNCSSLSCHNNVSVDFCTLVINGSASLSGENCNNSREFICMVEIGNKCYHLHCHKEYLIILALVSGLILFTTLAVVIWLLAYKRSKKRRHSRKLTNSAALALVPPSWKVFPKDELRSITKNFSEGNRLLGDAKTGGTYCGLLPDGSRVAVKRLKRSSFQRKKEFYSEIGRVARLHHPNLVAVIGCCYNHGDRYIVYEFIVNGPLDKWLHHIPRGGRSLDWTMRMKIATTLAQGIAFLHDKVKPHVVHHDIRASNVLLDEEFGAHLMGVGLSKFVPYEAVDSVGWQSIFEWATPLVQAHRYPDLLDPHIISSSSVIPEAAIIQKVVDLVYACTQHVPSMRPRMSHVVHQLQQLANPPIVKSSSILSSTRLDLQVLNSLPALTELQGHLNSNFQRNKTMTLKCSPDIDIFQDRAAIQTQSNSKCNIKTKHVDVVLSSQIFKEKHRYSPSISMEDNLVEILSKDSITSYSFLSDDSRGTTLVSSGQRFELGFFTPNGSPDNRRYVGIWYYGLSPRIVVWVANRDSPLSDTGGVFTIADDGNLKVLDKNGETYWSTRIERSSSMNRIAMILDTGNLALTYEEQQNNSVTILWQSFENPTDTFLPGMKLDENLVLTSWKSYDDPAVGNFSFQQDQERMNQVILLKRSVKYWRSGISGKFIGLNEMPSAILYLLSNFTSTVVRNNSVPYLTSSLYIHTRLVMSFSGQIQYFLLDTQKVWSLIWAVPRDKCSVFNACGNFGSCNSKNDLICKCLPGFKPTSPENWNTGDYSAGCARKSITCGNTAKGDTFLNLKMMKVGDPDSQFNAKNEMECKIECLNNCQCQAYLYEEADMTRRGGTGSSTCWIWSEDLDNLQEEYDSGQNLHVRVAVSDIESTARSCETCGTNLIPYPLSTGPKCGDPLYYSFRCNSSSDQVSFETPSGAYQVVSINPDTQKFVIQTKEADNCKNSLRGKTLLLNQALPFHLTGRCNADLANSSSEISFKNGDIVEISWDPPLEPPCSSSADCQDWPNSTCSATQKGKNRCICNINFRWDNLKLKCTAGDDYSKETGGRGKMTLALIIGITFPNSGGSMQKNAVLHLYDCERRVKSLIESGRPTDPSTKQADGKQTDAITYRVFRTYTATRTGAGRGQMHELGRTGYNCTPMPFCSLNLQMATSRHAKSAKLETENALA